MLRLLLALALLIGSASASVRPTTLGKLLELSETVVIARVVRAEVGVIPQPLQIFTDAHLYVEQTVAGVKVDGPLTLRQRGGEATTRDGQVFTQKIFGAAEFKEGERVLLFLERASLGNLVVAGMAQGKYTIERDPKTGIDVARRDLSGVYVHHHRGAVVTPPGIPSNPNEMPLETLLALLRRELRPARAVPVVEVRR